MDVGHLALTLLVPISIIAFKVWRPALAVASVYFISWLFLPEKIEFNLQGLPPFNKSTAPGFCVLLNCLLFYRSRLTSLRLLRWPEIVIFVLVFSSLFTGLSNTDPIVFGEDMMGFVPGLKARDIFSMLSNDILELVFPFVFGAIFYRTIDDLTDLLRILVGFALIYTPFIILEIALSPLFHFWVYGFYPHDFIQSVRYGGYRPSVFMAHGLALALYICCASLAAFGLGRRKITVFGLPAVLLGLFLAILLLISRSFAAIVYFIAIFPFIFFVSSRVQSRTALMLVTLIVSYPVLRLTDLFPTESLVGLVATIDDRRSISLADRFDSERRLMIKTEERPLFGWGGFRRKQVGPLGYLKRLDGYWIGRYTERGILGLLAAFSLLIAPVVIAVTRLKYASSKNERILIGTLCLIVSVYTVDLLPNGLFTTLPYFLAGALLSVSRKLGRQRGERHQALIRQIGVRKELST